MNTHERYNTIEHHHLDFTIPDGNSFDYPRSALMIVGCADGRWFIEQEFGDEYSHFAGVVKSSQDLVTEPTFYENLDDAARAACAFIKQVYPSVDDAWLGEFLGTARSDAA